MYSFMTIKYVPVIRKRDHHTICETHGVNKRICRKTPHKITGASAIPDWVVNGKITSRTVSIWS